MCSHRDCDRDAGKLPPSIPDMYFFENGTNGWTARTFNASRRSCHQRRGIEMKCCSFMSNTISWQ